MSDDERNAMEWLDARVASETMSRYAPATTIKRMLARPVLPEEPTREIRGAMQAAWMRSPDNILSDRLWDRLYGAIHAHLTAPRTREVEVERWVVIGPNGLERSTHAIHSLAVAEACESRGSVIRLTGKATVSA